MDFPDAHDEGAFLSQDPNEDQPYKLLNSIIVPRPVAFITTKAINGVVNAAPFSYFSAISTQPVLISVAMSHRNGISKDTARNILTTKEFVINICSLALAKAVNFAGQDFPPHISEIDLMNLSLLPSKKIAAPRIANTLIQLECVFKHKVDFSEYRGDLILGKVVQVHLHKKIMNHKGQIDIAKLNPLARLSGSYAKLTDFFEVH